MAGKTMSIEEMRLNKALLKEISRKKKERLGYANASWDKTFINQNVIYA